MAKLDMGFKTVELYMPGIYVSCTIPGETDKDWYITNNTIIWEESTEPVQMLTMCPVDAEGDIQYEREIKANSDMLDISIN